MPIVFINRTDPSATPLVASSTTKNYVIVRHCITFETGQSLMVQRGPSDTPADWFPLHQSAITPTECNLLVGAGNCINVTSNTAGKKYGGWIEYRQVNV